MNRTDRLYAIVEELRAAAPDPRSARVLAERFEVSVRTIERDIGALQQAGVPIYANVGRRGGYAIHRGHTLPPVNFSPAEAVAVALALADLDGPFAAAGRRARHKLLAAMHDDDAAAARELSERIHRYRWGREQADSTPAPSAIERAIAAHEVVSIDYCDRSGEATQREVEPLGLVDLEGRWYLTGWCRLRDDVRVFRIDRVQAAASTGERAPVRDPEVWIDHLPQMVRRPGSLD